MVTTLRRIGRDLVDGSVISIGTLLATGVLYLGLATAVTAYPSQPWVVASTTSGTATVTGCSRIPFVSAAGIGRRWECDALVRMPDGTRRAVGMRAGVASPADVGYPMTVLVSCSTVGHTGTCSYTRTGSLWAQVGMRAVWLISRFILVIGGISGLIVVAMTLYSPFAAWLNWRRPGPGSDAPDAVRDVAGPGVSASPDGAGGRVHVTFQQVSGPWGDIVFAESAPLLTIDKRAVEVAGWNTTTTIALPTGRHRLRVTLRWKNLTDRGEAQVTFDLRDGQERHFRYRPRESLTYGTLEETGG